MRLDTQQYEGVTYTYKVTIGNDVYYTPNNRGISMETAARLAALTLYPKEPSTKPVACCIESMIRAGKAYFTILADGFVQYPTHVLGEMIYTP